ncbi:MAG TPA: M2 family metallopeptidase [Candidatus Acidoferrales bacterium]|nr:M2 family metallopeptidase [Candidatus Acidoferrales bacterium]
MKIGATSARNRAQYTLQAMLVILGGMMAAQATNSESAPAQSAAAPTVEEARQFTDNAEKQLLDLWIKDGRADWVQATFITDDTEKMAADADEAAANATAELAEQARRFEGMKLPDDVARKLKLIKFSVSIPAPRDEALSAELSQINASLSSDYGKGKWCPDGPSARCLNIDEISDILADSRDPRELLDAWVGWHAVGAPMRQRYARMVGLANRGARDAGFADVGDMWRSGYDMPPADFGAEMDRLWEQVKPLYVSLHAYVRWKLQEKYGKTLVPDNGPIPAQLLGNLWAQDWTNIYPLLAPKDSDPGYDLTAVLKQRKIAPVDMVHYGERFFTSLGFAPLPATFWERSMFTRPRDRDVVCHASAWDIDYKDDLRIKMCIEQTAVDFTTIHHELGHNFYQRAYKEQPPLFANGANDGFHEAIGDTIALSVTPEYLKEIGLLDTVPPPSADTGLLLKRALDKVAFLPFGLMIDKWRWEVFSGQVKPADYNKAWWDLKREYQGVAAPVARTEEDFDPGAKYHVASNVPYARYFLAAVLEYQFHRALCKTAGFNGPLNRCSIYGNKAAGAKLNQMLEMGTSKPWPDELEVLTGQRDMDATAILDYYAPLKKWLDQQNQGHPVGW